MNARPYIFGCLCLVGANGTAAASDIDPMGGLLSLSGAGSSSAFEGSAPRGGQGGRDGVEVIVIHQGSASTRSNTQTSPPSPNDTDDMPRDGAAPMRSPAPSWQSLLPGSMF